MKQPSYMPTLRFEHAYVLIKLYNNYNWNIVIIVTVNIIIIQDDQRTIVPST